ncbi:MAG: TatD family hydrolase [Myxococcota bacterium]|jgi:TatD DNase family protein|nr:TatD family hydrolase [Myxococcota bacterium]
MELFDSHAHLDIERTTQKQLRALLDRAFEQGLVGIVAIAGATRVGEYELTLQLATDDRRIHAAAGIHPHAASGATIDALDKLMAVLDHERVVALGEIGLDYHYNYSPPAEQRRAFVAQLRMAHKAALPVIVHTRQAEADTAAILADEGVEQVGGVLHCFSSGVELARSALNLGLYISFSGMITFPKADEIRSIAAEVPIERILAETDTPFLSPHPMRGRTNEPSHVKYVVEKLAQIREIDAEEMARVCTANTRQCFRLLEALPQE